MAVGHTGARALVPTLPIACFVGGINYKNTHRLPVLMGIWQNGMQTIFAKHPILRYSYPIPRNIKWGCFSSVFI